jgi:hypothetical protein
MRENLTAALQARWETSLRDLAAFDPHSPVPLLDNLLAPYRGARQDAADHRAPGSPWPDRRARAKPGRTSRIPPNMETAPSGA